MRRSAGTDTAAGGPPRTRSVITWILGIAGLAAYNWWLLVPVRPGLMSSPDELFSNLEVTGQPFAALMQRADLTAGILFCCSGHSRSPGMVAAVPGGAGNGWRC